MNSELFNIAVKIDLKQQPTTPNPQSHYRMNMPLGRVSEVDDSRVGSKVENKHNSSHNSPPISPVRDIRHVKFNESDHLQ